jgi:hypothetical protein
MARRAIVAVIAATVGVAACAPASAQQCTDVSVSQFLVSIVEVAIQDGPAPYVVHASGNPLYLRDAIALGQVGASVVLIDDVVGVAAREQNDSGQYMAWTTLADGFVARINLVTQSVTWSKYLGRGSPCTDSSG